MVFSATDITASGYDFLFNVHFKVLKPLLNIKPLEVFSLV